MSSWNASVGFSVRRGSGTRLWMLPLIAVATVAKFAAPPLLGSPLMGVPLPSIYNALLETHPVTTRVATAASLAVLGDALAQQREHSQHSQHSQRYDVRRASSFVVVEAVYRGLLQQPLFLWIIATFHGEGLARALAALSLSAPLPVLATLERVLFNQFVVSPCVYYPMYFGITGPMQGLTLRESWQRARNQFSTLFGFNLCFWLPVQLIQFGMVPARYKVPFICLGGLIWNVILSALAGSARQWRERLSGDANAKVEAAGVAVGHGHGGAKGVVVHTSDVIATTAHAEHAPAPTPSTASVMRGHSELL